MIDFLPIIQMLLIQNIEQKTQKLKTEDTETRKTKTQNDENPEKQELELRFCAVSSPARGVTEICDGGDL